MKPEDRILVGANYFAGWWRESPNKWTTSGRDWRLDYPERIPSLGCYNDLPTMEYEIDAASDFGVDFFAMLWYPQIRAGHEQHTPKLNDGLRHILRARNADRIRFYVEYTNHAPFDVREESVWRTCCAEWADAMTHPSYLRVAGRPVLKIHGREHFIRQMGEDWERVASFVGILRETVASRGVGDLLVGVGTSPVAPPSPERFDVFDFYSTYMGVPDLPQRESLYPYGTLLDMARKGWLAYAARSPVPYAPYLPSGWNPRPWNDLRASFATPTRDEWRDALVSVKAVLETSSRLGFPAGDAVQKAFTIYAWNEYGEGGYLAPTLGEGTMKLEAIREVFRKSVSVPSTPTSNPNH